MIASPTVAAVLVDVERRLRVAGIGESRLEARILVERCLGLERAQLHARPERQLTPEGLCALEVLVARRASREPLAYVTGEREFFGLRLLVDRRALVPRPETELLVELALAVLAESTGGGASEAPRVADVGTGCGAVAVALAIHRPDAVVLGLDASAEALELAAANCRRCGVTDRVALVRGDLLDPLASSVDLIAANLPYVPTGQLRRLQPEVRREPRLALDGGADGLDLYGRLLARAPDYLRPGGALLFEIGAGQGKAAAALAGRAFPQWSLRVLGDLAGLDRIVVVRRAGVAARLPAGCRVLASG